MCTSALLYDFHCVSFQGDIKMTSLISQVCNQSLDFTVSEYILTLLSLLVKFNLIKNRKLYICCGTYRALITEYNHFHTPAYCTMQKTCLKKQNNAVIHWQFSFKREHSDVLITLYTHIPFKTPPNPKAEPRRVPYLSYFSPLNHLTILLLKKHLSEWNQITG